MCSNTGVHNVNLEIHINYNCVLVLLNYNFFFVLFSSFRVHFNCKNEIVCLDNRCYEKVEAFPNQSSPKKTQTTHSTRCDASKPAAALPQIHFHVGQQRQQREILNLEPVYECPQ